MFEKVHHIGIAVKELEESIRVFEKLLGSTVIEREEVENQKVRLAMLGVGEYKIELLEATDPDSPIARFIEKKGAGIHHICFDVEDIVKELERLREHGFQLIDEKPRRGADGCLVAFIHPKSTNGVLFELSQREV